MKTKIIAAENEVHETAMDDLQQKLRRCKFCGETDPAKFYVNRHLSKTKCASCRSIQMRLRLRERRIEVVKLLGGRCSRCGYDKCIAALHLHHTDPSMKDPDWKNIRKHSLDKIRERVGQCELLCSNCHAELHWGNLPEELVRRFSLQPGEWGWGERLTSLLRQKPDISIKGFVLGLYGQDTPRLRIRFYSLASTLVTKGILLKIGYGKWGLPNGAHA